MQGQVWRHPAALIFFDFPFFVSLFLEATPILNVKPHPTEFDSSQDKGPWKFGYILNEIRSLRSPIQVAFHHVFRSANDLTALLAKQWIDRVEPFVGLLFEIFFFFWQKSLILHLCTVLIFFE